MEKEKFEARKKELQKVMASIGTGGSANPNLELARIVGSPFDPENPVTDVIGAVYKTATVDIGEDYEYFVADQDTKTVTTVLNGSITQTAVTPLSTQDLSFNHRSSEEFLVYVDKLIEGKHDMLAKKRIALTEALDRIDNRDAIQCIDTAVEVAREFSLDSGVEKFTYPKLVEMVRSIARYAQMSTSAGNSDTIQSNLVLITGANVTQDILLMDYDADKNRRTVLTSAGISRWIPVDEQQVVLSGTGSLDVIDADTAYLVAPSFATDRETAHFVRRRVRTLDGSGTKERITASRGPLIPEGATPRWAYGIAAMESTGCVVVNPKPIAKFTRS